MFHADRRSRSTPLQLVRLWQHECARVFHDRILDPKEREWFVGALAEVGWLLGLLLPFVRACCVCVRLAHACVCVFLCIG